MDKKGFSLLGEESVKIIISVLALIILIGLLAKIYYTSQQDVELEQAEATLNQLIKEINDMKEGENREFIIYNPEEWPFNWIIISFKENQEKPRKCLNNKECLCICKSSIIDKYSKQCDDKGVCKELNTNIENIQIKIKNTPMKILLEKSNEDIKIIF